MRASRSIGIASAIILVLAAAGFYRLMRGPISAGTEAPVATPPGITIQLAGNVPFTTVIGYDLRRNAGQELAYADSQGMSFYIFDRDNEPGKSSCSGDCAKAWPPALAPADAKALGDWSIVDRGDGGRQWAWKGKPLYTNAKDMKIGDASGKASAADGWHLAAFKPATGMKLPTGVAVQEVGDANGQALVNARGMTLYAFDGEPAQEKKACAMGTCVWTPFAAPAVANPIGDFSLVDRGDGIVQWAFDGKLLYTYAGDLEPGDANGGSVDERWRPALVTRYFMPAQVMIRQSAAFGPILTTRAGMTIYRREAYIYQLGGHGLRHGVPPRPLVGRNIGTKGCDAACLRAWRPLEAPADSQPSGYWGIAVREDGSRQWTYKGYALYTYTGDTKPGDMTGNDQYEMLISEDPHKAEEMPSRFTGAGGLVWIHADP